LFYDDKKTNDAIYLKCFELFKEKYIYINKYIKCEQLPVNYDINNVITNIFDPNYIDWIKKIVSLELISIPFKNIRLLDCHFNNVELALLLSTKNCAVLIENNDDELIKNGIIYRNMVQYVNNTLQIPSIKTEFHIIRLNNCVVLERGNSGFFLLNRGQYDLSINDIYLDWNTQLSGLYKLVSQVSEIYVKIIVNGRNKIMIGIHNINKNYGYYFYKISDDVGEYTLSGPTMFKNNNTNNNINHNKIFCANNNDFPTLIKKKK
jgi:hypothetical protein